MFLMITCHSYIHQFIKQSEAFTYLSVASSVHLTNPAETMVALACGALLLICFLVDHSG
jgi:hypothetical protein